MTKSEQKYLVQLGKEFKVVVEPCIMPSSEGNLYAVLCGNEFKTSIVERAYTYIRESEEVTRRKNE